MAIRQNVNALAYVKGKMTSMLGLGLLLTLATVTAAGAAEIKVFSTIGVRAVLQDSARSSNERPTTSWRPRSKWLPR